VWIWDLHLCSQSLLAAGDAVVGLGPKFLERKQCILMFECILKSLCTSCEDGLEEKRTLFLSLICLLSLSFKSDHEWFPCKLGKM